MMTGRYPHRNGVTGFKLGVAAGVPTISELLDDAGYETALLGKINASLAKLKANGTVDKILAKWGL